MCGGFHHCNGYAKKIMLTLVGVLLVYAVFYLGTAIRNNLKKYNYIGMADKMERTITVNGFGKVTGNNDIAVTSIGYSDTDKDVAKAQADNKKVMDKVMSALLALGIDQKDLQTDYRIYPDYKYTQDKGQELIGYRVSQTITIKIRDLSKINAVLSLPGEYGATEVGGLSFTIDDPENLKEQAKDKALTDAKTKAQKLAGDLGIRLGKVVSYNDYGGPAPYEYKVYAGAAGGMGGGGPDVVAPGTNDITMNVSIVYEILP